MAWCTYIGNGDLCPGPGPVHCSVVPAQAGQEPEPAHRSMVGVVVFTFYLNLALYSILNLAGRLQKCFLLAALKKATSEWS